MRERECGRRSEADSGRGWVTIGKGEGEATRQENAIRSVRRERLLRSVLEPAKGALVRSLASLSFAVTLVLLAFSLPALGSTRTSSSAFFVAASPVGDDGEALDRERTVPPGEDGFDTLDRNIRELTVRLESTEPEERRDAADALGDLGARAAGALIELERARR